MSGNFWESLDEMGEMEQSRSFTGSNLPEGKVISMVLALSDLLFEPGEDWRESAACAGTDDALFFPVGDEGPLVDQAKSICAACPVSDACLQYALSTNQTEGLWGGMTSGERRRLRRRLRDRERRAS